MGDELDARLEALEHGFGHRQTGNDTRGLGDNATVKESIGVQGRFTGCVTWANVLGDSQVYQGISRAYERICVCLSQWFIPPLGKN